MPGSVRRLGSVPNPISAGPAWPARSAAIPSLICSDAFRVRGASGLRCWPEAERPRGDPGECGHRPPRGGRGEHGGQARAEGRVADVGCSVVDRRADPGVVAQMPFDQPGQQWSRSLSGRYGGRGARSGWTKRKPEAITSRRRSMPRRPRSSGRTTSGTSGAISAIPQPRWPRPVQAGSLPSSPDSD
jgi:hypothetical protein